MSMPVVQTMKDHMSAIAVMVILEMDRIALVSTMILIDMISALTHLLPAIAMLVILEMDGIALVSTMILIDIFSVLTHLLHDIYQNLLQTLMNV